MSVINPVEFHTQLLLLNNKIHSRRVLQLQILAPSLGSRAGFWMKLQATQAG